MSPFKGACVCTVSPPVKSVRCQWERRGQRWRGRCTGAGGWWCGFLGWSGRTWTSGCRVWGTAARGTARSWSPTGAQRCAGRESTTFKAFLWNSKYFQSTPGNRFKLPLTPLLVFVSDLRTKSVHLLNFFTSSLTLTHCSAAWPKQLRDLSSPLASNGCFWPVTPVPGDYVSLNTHFKVPPSTSLTLLLTSMGVSAISTAKLLRWSHLHTVCVMFDDTWTQPSGDQVPFSLQ